MFKNKVRTLFRLVDAFGDSQLDAMFENSCPLIWILTTTFKFGQTKICSGFVDSGIQKLINW